MWSLDDVICWVRGLLRRARQTTPRVRDPSTYTSAAGDQQHGQQQQQGSTEATKAASAAEEAEARRVISEKLSTFEMDYVVLREFAPVPTSAGTAAMGPKAAASKLPPQVSVSVSYDKLTGSAAASLVSDPHVKAIVYDCPTRLVEPVRYPPAQSGQGAGAYGGFTGRAAGTVTRLVEPVLSDQLTAAASGGRCTWGIAAVGADNSLWTGEGVTVAVLDTGYDPNHPAFAALRAKGAIESRDFTNPKNGPVEQDNHGHGTHVLATIVGADVRDSSSSSSTRIGVARSVSKVLVGKVLADDGTGQASWLVKGLKWAWKNQAHVINISVDFAFASRHDQVASAYAGLDPRVVHRIIDNDNLNEQSQYTKILSSLHTYYEASLGVSPVIIAAAGNGSIRNHEPQALISSGFPASLDFVMSVAAVDFDRQVADFSNVKATFSGPGVGVLSAQSKAVEPSDLLIALNGTSMAAPHVAGVAALWWQKLIREYRLRPPADYVATELKRSCIRNLVNYNIRDFGQGLVQAP